MLLLKALLLGIVEGVTEFLPISSTGHLIVVGDMIGFNGAKAQIFEIVIQLGAILAVCWLYRHKLIAVLTGLKEDPGAQRFAINLVVAFLPAAMLGLLLHNVIKHYLFTPTNVGFALIEGGLVILLIERLVFAPRVHTVEQMSWRDALRVGLAQTLSLIPGISRSGATIMGGVVSGLSRAAATEFSFFLAIPVMFAATGLELLSNWKLFAREDIGVFAVGFIAAFISAALAVTGFIRFVSKHDFSVFAYYRIVFGALVLLYVRYL